ncbi:hypothetical protein TNIN_291121 [Trichonephila inaurata madagascariensis]|uniref:Uncharacterized protein n=1 Tax=Trichonephila inaurata madagascariensis TaxID=2747483 RepID=A0A8X7BP54_9ARAC|nr:hypothetical protein TNIN_291121 [Trichonephila inaurata madagascariensis]
MEKEFLSDLKVPPSIEMCGRPFQIKINCLVSALISPSAENYSGLLFVMGGDLVVVRKKKLPSLPERRFCFGRGHLSSTEMRGVRKIQLFLKF